MPLTLGVFSKFFSTFGRKVGTKFAAKTAAKTVSKSTLLKAVGGTAVGTYLITALNGVTSVSEGIAEILGVPDWAGMAILAGAVALVFVFIASKISSMWDSHREYRAKMARYRLENRELDESRARRMSEERAFERRGSSVKNKGRNGSSKASASCNRKASSGKVM